MKDFIYLMHSDSARSALAEDDGAWGPYVESLIAQGCFGGGSAMSGGVCVNKAGTSVELSMHIVGFVRVQARDLEHALELLKGNPTYEAGGTVEVRELPRDE